MESFLEFFERRNSVILEYRHKDAFGGIKMGYVNPQNKKGGSDIARMPNRKNLTTKGPYKKRKSGDILIGNELLKELGSMGGVEFKDGKIVKRKNTKPKQEIHLFINLHGQQCGKIVEVNK